MNKVETKKKYDIIEVFDVCADVEFNASRLIVVFGLQVLHVDLMAAEKSAKSSIL